MAEVTDKLKRDFILAAWNGQVEKMQGILAQHPDAPAWTGPVNGHTALISAVASGSMAEKATDLLLSLNANVNAQDAKGMTALMHAADNGGIDAARKLLSKGADAALCNKEGYTAAQIADFKDNVWSNVIAALIRRHEAEQAAERVSEIERCAAELTRQEAAQAHDGLSRAVVVGKPLLLKR